MIVAIDGPAGAGKSTVARRLAERLGLRYLDTGAMYRAVTWLALERGVAVDDETALAALARSEPVEFGDDDRVRIAGTDITAAIREARIDRAVPVVAAQEQVREVLRARQRELGEAGDVVIEGRDIGTVVAPNAAVKVYLVADVEERVRRRGAERPEASASDLRRRDESDSVRMQQAADAELIDTTHLGIEDVVDRIEQLVEAARAAA